MKRTISLSTFAVIFTLIGCVKSTIIETTSEKNAVVVSPEVTVIIEDMGFSTDDIYVTNDAYIVEGDIVIREDIIDDTVQKPKTRHSRYSIGDRALSQEALNGRRNPNTGKSVIYIGTQFENDVMDATAKVAIKRYRNYMNEVISEFNSVTGFGIELSRLDSPVADIYVQWNGAMWMNTDVLMVAEIPNGSGVYSRPGYRICLNPALKSWSGFSAAKVKVSLLQAIGHCIGLGHTDFSSYSGSGSPLGEDGYGNEQITLSGIHNDNSSVMHSSNGKITGGQNTTGKLTDGDKAALCIMYPFISAGTITPVTQTVAITQRPTQLTCSVAVGVKKSSYRWQRSRNGVSDWTYASNATSSPQPYLPVTESGSYRVEVTSPTLIEPLYSNVASVLVKIPSLTAGSIAGDQTVLLNTRPAAIMSVELPTGGDGSYTYQWMQSPDGKSSWTDLNTSNGAESYQPPILNSTIYYKRLVFSGSKIASSNVVKITVFNPSIVLVGPEPTIPDVYEIFGVGLAPGVTFLGWTATPSTYSTMKGLKNPSLTISFNSYAIYTLKASFILPDGSLYSISRTVDISSPPSPLISASSGQQILLPQGYSSPVEYGTPILWIRPGTYLELSVANTHEYSPLATFQWMIPMGGQGAPQYTGTSQFVNISTSAGGFWGYHCIATHDGVRSERGDIWMYVGDTTPPGSIEVYVY